MNKYIIIGMLIGLMVLVSGCVESGYNEQSVRHHTLDISCGHVSPLTTQHVSGIDVTTNLNNVGTLHVSGICNSVTISNSNIENIYLSGVDNIVYIPTSATPYISQSGIDCIINRY